MGCFTIDFLCVDPPSIIDFPHSLSILVAVIGSDTRIFRGGGLELRRHAVRIRRRRGQDVEKVERIGQDTVSTIYQWLEDRRVLSPRWMGVIFKAMKVEVDRQERAQSRSRTADLLPAFFPSVPQ
jgi:hypothetical protein